MLERHSKETRHAKKKRKLPLSGIIKVVEFLTQSGSLVYVMQKM
jgi:hypothetical protein